jgi:hypothetical protein
MIVQNLCLEGESGSKGKKRKIEFTYPQKVIRNR